MMQRRPEFSFPGSPARGLGRALPPRPRPPANMVAPRPDDDEEEIRWLQASRQGSPDYTSSGTPSPPLWAHHHDREHRLHPASEGSSPSRAQAIAGYRREMLDLVRGLPESAYELSLRDIVERPSPSSAPLPTPPPAPRSPPPSSNAADAAVVPRGHEPAANTADEQAAKQQQQSGAIKKQGRKQRAVRKQRSRSLERSVSLDTGLLIKFFMPLSIGRGKKKVSPKPDAKDAKKKKSEKTKKQGTKEEAKQKQKQKQKQDEEWWTKSEFSEAGSSCRTSSTGSSNDSITNGAANPRAPVRSRSRTRNGCYAFFRAHKSKNGVSQD